ncbi:MAG: MFS transporter [Ignavibacteriales bacterium]|nr:MFS transporter [Ignavibacteriales bacterium]
MSNIPSQILALPTFKSLRHKNYRLFFAGQIFSLAGTWMQSMAQAWLVYQLTYSAVWLGTIGFLNSIPILFLSMFGGSLADRMSKRKLIIITQLISLVQALMLAVLVLADLVTVHIVAALALSLGIINAFDIPARQSYIVDLVGKENLTNAIALNSATFNAARIVGPAIGGVVIAAFGVGWCFVLNAFSFCAVIISLMYIRTAYTPDKKTSTINVIESLKESITYVRSDSSLVALMILVGVITIFGWSYSVLLPIFADTILNIGAIGLGNLMTSVGIGAFISAVMIASFESRIQPSSFIYAGITLFVICISIFALSSNVSLSLLCLMGVGMGLVMFLATANATIQRSVPDHLRGRMMGLYSLIFQGLSPFGSLGMGLLANVIGVRGAVLAGSIVCGIAVLSIQHWNSAVKNNRNKTL